MLGSPMIGNPHIGFARECYAHLHVSKIDVRVLGLDDDRFIRERFNGELGSPREPNTPSLRNIP